MPLILKLIILAALIYGAMQIWGYKDKANEALHGNERVFGDVNAVMEGNYTGEDRKDALKKVVK